MKIFAYGSNMNLNRLKERVPSANKLLNVFIKGYTIKCNKISTDGSSKANIIKTSNDDDIVWGVIFDIDNSEKSNLDEYEGGYNESTLSFLDSENNPHEAQVYIADESTVNEELLPYDWYKEYIVSGAKENDLPQEYIEKLEAINFIEDTNTERRNKNLGVSQKTEANDTTENVQVQSAILTMNKGSEWRKWDLHVHTPFSILNNGFGNDWDVYVKKLFTKALENNVCAIGITDYFTIEGYKKLKREYLGDEHKLNSLFTPDEIEKIKKILILPNVEFRLKKLVGSNRINFHVLFSDTVKIEDIEENFLHELDFVYESGPQTEDEKHKLKERNLQELGRKLKAQHEAFRSKSDLEIGMMNAVVDDEQITQILINKASKFKNKYFILLPCDEDLSKVSWNGQDHQARKLLIQKSDILIATNPNTIKWALGQFNDSVQDYITEFKSLKPCIGGSDSHNYEELFVKNSERGTWIKADVSFEGLRQIIFEPAGRVHLSKEKPNKKDAKNIIEEVKIISSDNTFTNKSLFFNDNLNVIIGGKSSGKSILLYNIARTLFQDSNEHSLLKFYNPDTKKEEYKYEFGADFDFIVKLKSGATQSIKRQEPSILSGIKYIPQNYLSELAERKFKKSNELNKLVRDLILEDSESNAEYDYFLTRVKQNDKFRESLINNYFNITNDINELKQRLISIGNKDALHKNISNIDEEMKKLKEEAGFGTQENEKFDRLKESDKILKSQHSNVEKDWRRIRDFNSELSSNINELISRKNLFLTSIQDEDIKAYYSAKYSALDEIANRLDEINKDILRNDNNQFINDSIIKNKLDSIEESMAKNTKELEPFNLKIEIRSKIDSFQKSQSEDESKLNNILSLEKEIKSKEDALKIEFNKIFELYQSNFDEYTSVISKLEKRINSLEDENLQIKGIVKFNFNNFKDGFIEISNSTSKSYDGYDLFSLDNTSIPEVSKLIEEKKDIFNRIVANDYKLRRQTSPVQAVKDLLYDNYFDYWEVSSNNDILYKMSAGKASFIILKLIIGLSKSDAPILIDQPEDNLDNRSITKELIEYLKSKKQERQIILVTHNPNIVVNADAENIMIAHQYGQNANESIEEFKFDYINGALENSFDFIPDSKNILESMGIREHIADIVEGGKDAFLTREKKYRFH
ncbi:gamma-glutamylcyclotransferase [Elizabethkingia anophelis]|nr:gamma-glutamylcyclotransferase [Elizabethkingia anophelis]MCT3994721.1 gamma-glutamylcyclotransferase [Elizabethkingia anophelis]MCT3998211.1 gamma-glutamylcyclotransferase [Elizabethkingia anophelis]MCT4254073.1 gamma-glutamylcyclotransferase [Elizabethkingia anophelis]